MPSTQSSGMELASVICRSVNCRLRGRKEKSPCGGEVQEQNGASKDSVRLVAGRRTSVWKARRSRAGKLKVNVPIESDEYLLPAPDDGKSGFGDGRGPGGRRVAG
jgi:hypothetical protein